MSFLGSLIIVAAPSGAGKTSLVKSMANSTADIEISVSHTTRAKREGETEGVDYHFVSQPEFAVMVEQGEFLEHANVFGNLYGTSQRWVESRLAAGTDILLEIDWQGAAQVRKLLPEAISVFILPPSKDTLRQRLEGRGQDSANIIAERMAKATNEMSHYPEFDYLIVNDDFAEALANLTAIVRSQRLKKAQRDPKVQKLITELLS